LFINDVTKFIIIFDTLSGYYYIKFISANALRLKMNGLSGEESLFLLSLVNGITF